MSHPIEELLKKTMENLKNIIDVDTIIGKPINGTGNCTIIPVSKVSLGFASAGSEFAPNDFDKELNSEYPFGGGSGGGLSVKPVAFLLIKDGNYRILPVGEENTVNKIIDSIPQLLDMMKNNCCCSTKDKKEEKKDPQNTNKQKS
ncbi:sporulation protein YtfJ [Hathewaya proteolytica DSM 3090]|uniref:Sporulation protein YtfJ n=1 Tax=Hathewaya proteolytica DSM 3090 TaxID=1121331 RepID=A0A1M6KZR8_9CLOT|nr:GerW family sporulation protein [Hathewaya proteolytica]SHJ64364.1 sporulation protein YtfJ [Hathewaya proteolytica DSM 3090]